MERRKARGQVEVCCERGEAVPLTSAVQAEVVRLYSVGVIDGRRVAVVGPAPTHTPRPILVRRAAAVLVAAVLLPGTVVALAGVSEEGVTASDQGVVSAEPLPAAEPEPLAPRRRPSTTTTAATPTTLAAALVEAPAPVVTPARRSPRATTTPTTAAARTPATTAPPPPPTTTTTEPPPTTTTTQPLVVVPPVGPGD